MGLQRWPINDFRGGLNTKDGPFELEPNEARDLLNVTLTRRGAISQRLGKTRFDSSGFPANKVAEHMRNWYRTPSDRRLMLSIDGTVYECSTVGALTSKNAGTAGTIWSFEQATDAAGTQYLWMLNGSDTPKKYDGTTVSNWANSPPNGTMMRLWQNRMVIAGVAATPQRLFWSAIGDPESPATTYGSNFKDMKITDDDLDPITWLEVLGDYLVVFKRQSVWVVTDPNTFATRRIGSPGCEDRFQSAVIGGKVYYFHRSGIWSTGGVNAPVFESVKVENYITDNLDYSKVAKVRVAASRDRRLYVAMPFTASAGNNRLLEFIPDMVTAGTQGSRSARTGAWTVHDLPVASLATFRPINTDVLMGGASDAAKLHELFLGTSDDGVAINAYWVSSWKSIIAEEMLERVRRLNVQFSGDLVVDLFQDFQDASKFSGTMSTITDADPYWDGGDWDGGQWDTASPAFLGRLRPEKRGRYHSVKISNNVLNKTFTVYTIELAIRGGKEHTK